jgi:DmsE family decaheme c-type cytochrome
MRRCVRPQLWTVIGLVWSVLLVIAIVAAAPPAKAAGPIPGARAAAPYAAVEATDATQQPGAAQVPVVNPADYVGEATCLTCHEGQKDVGKAHAFKVNPRTPAATYGCESCHGPGKAHVDGGGDATKILRLGSMKPGESSAACTTCHNRATHALWSGSQHDQRNVGCVTCHSVHTAKGDKQLKTTREAEVCATCHRNTVNKQSRVHHMPIREGGLTCSSCHNVHGSSNVRLLKAGTTIDESCTSCHAEKRGPYLWEHAPVSESCTTCHDPHGSNNDRMLVAKQPFLCQRCHVTSRHPPTVYEGNLLQNSANGNKIYGRACTVCHQLVHGSNAPSGKAFLR